VLCKLSKGLSSVRRAMEGTEPSTRSDQPKNSYRLEHSLLLVFAVLATNSLNISASISYLSCITHRRADRMRMPHIKDKRSKLEMRLVLTAAFSAMQLSSADGQTANQAQVGREVSRTHAGPLPGTSKIQSPPTLQPSMLQA
jgi:hypothetical protein